MKVTHSTPLTTSKLRPGKAGAICSLISLELGRCLERIRRRALGSRIPYAPPTEYLIPDTAPCRRALEIVREVSPSFLSLHCLRSYAFGMAMRDKAATDLDEEVFFLGSVMHDLGLTSHYDQGDTFELDGAVAARSICDDCDLATPRADLVHEMVALHNSVGIAHRLDPEIALLHYGAGVDVAGLWLERIHPKTVQEIVAEYPRERFKEGMIRLLSDQIERKPSSYMSTLMELGFGDKINAAPFPE